MSSKIYHIQATLELMTCNEDDEHLIETVYSIIHLKLVLSLNKYENFYITEMKNEVYLVHCTVQVVSFSYAVEVVCTS